MALLTGLILSDDEAFRRESAAVLRSGTTPVTVGHERTAAEATPDLVLVDGRHNTAAAVASIERLRAATPGLSIFMVALEASPDAILQAMRAGANEFLTWPPVETAFHEAITRAAARRDSSPSGRPRATTAVFFGAKG